MEGWEGITREVRQTHSEDVAASLQIQLAPIAGSLRGQ